MHMLGRLRSDPGVCDQPLFSRTPDGDDDAEYGSCYTQSLTKWLGDLGVSGNAS